MWKIPHLFWKGYSWIQGAFQNFLKSFTILKCGVSNGYIILMLICEILEFFGKYFDNDVESSKNPSHNMLKVQETLQFASSK
jgi:hypothetical protein